MFKNIIKIIALVVVGAVYGQSTLNSPYSSFGLGTDAPQNGAVNNSTGVGLAFSSSLFLNTQNPALLNRSHNVIFEYGVNLDANWISTKNQTGNSSSMNIHYLGMSIPVSKKWTSSLGFTPLYRKSFVYNDESTFSNGQSISFAHNGQSSTNKVYLGNAYHLLNDTTRKFTLDVGLEPYFVFGSGEEEKLRTLDGESFSTGEKITTGAKGWGVKGGLAVRKELMQYAVRIDKGVLESYSFGKAFAAIKEHDKPKEGKYFVLFPTKKKVIFSSKIIDIKVKKHIQSVLVYNKLKNEGLYIKPEAVTATDEQLKNELISLRDLNDTTSQLTMEPVREYYKQGSGVYLNTGLTYEAEGKLSLSVVEQQFVQNIASTANVSIDTITSTDEIAYLPSTIGIGLGIEKPFAKGYHGDGTKRTGSWALGADLKLTNWSKTSGATNTAYVGLGGEIVPDAQNRNEKNSERGEFSKYLRRVVYRAGVNYSTLPYKVGNASASKFGINFGLSLPVGTIRSYTRPKFLNIGFAYEQIGDLSSNGIKEQLFRTTFSFTMNERWFRKWKIGF